VRRWRCENTRLDRSKGKPVAGIQVLVAATSPDIEAEGIAAAVEACVDMSLVGGRAVPIAEIEGLLAAIPRDPPRVLLLVGPDSETEFAERRLTGRVGLVVIRVNTPFGNLVRTAFNDISLQNLLDQVRVLAEPHASPSGEASLPDEAGAMPAQGALLDAAIAWLHARLRNAVSKAGAAHGDWPGLTVAPTRIVEHLDADSAGEVADDALREADKALDQALATADAHDEPLAAVVSSMSLTALETRVLLLALAPELDHRYQRCIGVLLDDLGRRIPTLGLCTSLLGDAVDVRFQLEASGNLARWRVFEGQGVLPPADEGLRLDPALVGWLLGDDGAMLRDPRVHRLFRAQAWTGADLVGGADMRSQAAELMHRLAMSLQWLLLPGDDTAAWRALLELGAHGQPDALLRVDGARVATLDDVEETGLRIGRAALLSDRSLVIDLGGVDDNADIDDALQRFLFAVGRAGTRAGLLCRDAARASRLLGAMPFERLPEPPLAPTAHVHALREAARSAGLALTETQARNAARRFSLDVAGIDEAGRLAATDTSGTAEQRLERFLLACKQVASRGLSHLAERVEPIFTLDQVVLPEDRKSQLDEIVDNVLLSDRVLRDWAFAEQLPCGRGVTALFHGPSGTGKTMAALAVARKLGIQLLRIDLSRVVSKYIGETEKNIDRVFDDAQRSGSALLIDEADALLGKRSEVKDAHDRYANIEVAYLLQRMEAYEGLAIMTTNLRQNLDSAFLRRLRFIIDFPRPDAQARETIWRQCLPERARHLDDADFRHLARRVELTGGHIRQITLRAAFMAAAADTTIGMPHITRATNAEYAKLGMAPVSLERSNARRAA
jgi:AAA+ superfamily predicted ATPase